MKTETMVRATGKGTRHNQNSTKQHKTDKTNELGSEDELEEWNGKEGREVNVLTHVKEHIYVHKRVWRREGEGGEGSILVFRGGHNDPHRLM